MVTSAKLIPIAPSNTINAARRLVVEDYLIWVESDIILIGGSTIRIIPNNANKNMANVLKSNF